MLLEMQAIGNLGADATIKDFNGRKFISFNLGCSEKYTDKNGVQTERTTWVSCLKMIRNEQSTLAGFLRKGTQVYIRGRVSCRAFTRNDGTMDASLNCNVNELQLLSSSKQPTQAQNSAIPNTPTTNQPSAPTRPQNDTNQQLQQAQQLLQNVGFMPVEQDGDLPF